MNQSLLKNEPSAFSPQTASFPKYVGLLFGLLLSWLALCSISVGLLQSFLPSDWAILTKELLALVLLAVGLILPTIAFVGLTFRQSWREVRPLATALFITSLYILITVTIRVIVGPSGKMAEPSWLEISLRLTVLTGLTLLMSMGGLWWSEIRLFEKSKFLGALGLKRPSMAGFLTGLALLALLTIGWPLTGALGDSQVVGLILLQALAFSLPEELWFRGSLWEMVGRKFPQPRFLGAFISLLMYLAVLPSEILPHGEWAKLFLLVGALPAALIVTELRVVSGSIWAGLLFAWFYRATPALFSDPRVEVPLISQPWQTLAYLWMIGGAIILFLLLWGGRQFLSSQSWQTPRWAMNGLAMIMAFVSWGLWLGGWFSFGLPGFYNDGFLIIMQEQANLSGASAITDLTARRAFVRDHLIETAERTQPPVREALKAAGLRYRSYYIVNMLKVEGEHSRMENFAHLLGVARVVRNPNVRPYPFPFKMDYPDAPDNKAGVGWNIQQVKADQVWQMGITGQGIVVAGQDTGYDWEHPAIKKAYRGNSSGPVDHNYNWHDAWAESAAAFDDDQHGTHTMGTILGDDGQGNQIGMAPGAKWIGCRNMRRGIGNPASYIECMEFFLAPYPIGTDFTKGEVSKSPQVINNSWGCPDIEGCDDNILEPATEALRAAGIMMVVSAGNDGPSCQTVIEPPARYDDVFSVGATTEDGLITGFSSRGPIPAAIPSAELLKPDIVAPGDNVRSSLPGGTYGLASGTSMAGPHVVGLVALLWSANPNLIGQIDKTEEIIRLSAIPLEVKVACPLSLPSSGDGSWMDELEGLGNPSPCACGNAIGTPNNVYGWGKIDALAAVKLALDLKK